MPQAIQAPEAISELTDGKESGAVFSDCERYRYLLWRCWEPETSTVAFIGLNPSTADAQRHDPTIRRMIGFAKRWGHGAAWVANLYAYRATRPEDLFKARHPEGPDNRAWLEAVLRNCDQTILCWGNQGHSLACTHPIKSKFHVSDCLGINQSGAPVHPLYLAATTEPRSYSRGTSD